MKNANVMIALVVGLVLGLVVGRMTVDTDTSGGPGRGEVAAGHTTGSADTSAAARAAAATDQEIFKVDIETARFKGSENALVTIVEFSNFQCGFCGRVQPTLKQLLEEYGDKVRLAYMHMPLPNMPNTHPAAQAAEAAGEQGKFWEYQDKLFANQRSLDRPSLERFAQELGLDMAKFRSDLDNEVHKDRVNEHVRIGQSLGVRGTPGFFINGRSVRGAQPIENFKTIINEEIRRAEAVLSAGVKQADLYATLVAQGKTGSAPERPEAAERQAPPRPQFGRPDVNNAHAYGPADALVTIVEYSNVQCGFCVRVRPTIDRIKAEYGDQVRVLWKHQTAPGPGHLVAQAGEAAGEQGKFFEFMSKTFENARQIDRPSLEATAQSLGLDMDKFRAALDESKFAGRVDEHRAEGMRIGARGTPTFFINGRLFAGAQPFEQFKAIIDEEIAKANGLLQSGTPRGELYARIMDENEKSIGAPALPSVRPDALRRVPDLQRAQVRPPTGDGERADIDISTAVVKGARNAPVTIVEFSSFTCGFCGRVQPTLNQLLSEYDGKVRLAFMHRPLGEAAELAAQATMAANEQGKFWEYHDKLFANMRSIARPDLERYAQELGLDMGRFRSALDDGKFAEVVGQQSQAAMRAGAGGTPTFFINGRKIVGAQPIEAFKEVIDAELARAGAR